MVMTEFKEVIYKYRKFSQNDTLLLLSAKT